MFFSEVVSINIQPLVSIDTHSLLTRESWNIGFIHSIILATSWKSYLLNSSFRIEYIKPLTFLSVILNLLTDKSLDLAFLFNIL